MAVDFVLKDDHENGDRMVEEHCPGDAKRNVYSPVAFQMGERAILQHRQSRGRGKGEIGASLD
jgi:hypothetical protein